MKQFLNPENPAFVELEEKARGACIRFRNLELPTGCTPRHADIGFEIDRTTGSSRLYIQRGIQYDGSIEDIRNWVLSGQIGFASFADLKRWLNNEIGRGFVVHLPVCTDNHQCQPVSSLTDMDAVLKSVQRQSQHALLKEDDLLSGLSTAVKGQERPLRILASAVARHSAKKHPRRPLVLFAVGPTGVGKTKTAEVLAGLLPAGQDQELKGYQFLRLDMSEYQEAHRVSQLIGSPQGYIGHGEGSQLLDTLQTNPQTIVLFDEIEKAHPAILRLLMNAMDAGRLTSPVRTGGKYIIDCSRAIFLFTSNLGADAILEEHEDSGIDNFQKEDSVCRKQLLKAGIAPEIIGRIARFLVYRHLSDGTRAEIMALTITEVAHEYGISIKYIEPSVLITLLERQGSDAYGARISRYLIDEELGEVFAKAIKSSVSPPVIIQGPPFVLLTDCESAADEGQRLNV